MDSLLSIGVWDQSLDHALDRLLDGAPPLLEFLSPMPEIYKNYPLDTLVRVAWIKVDLDTNWKFSTDNFAQYYHAFNRFYGLFLFVTFCTKFAAMLNVRDEIRPFVEELMRHIDEELRWPELITMEELNLPSVSQMLRTMAHNARKAVEAASIWTWDDGQPAPSNDDTVIAVDVEDDDDAEQD